MRVRIRFFSHLSTYTYEKSRAEKLVKQWKEVYGDENISIAEEETKA